MVPPITVNGPAWWGFGRDGQHSAVAGIASQDLNRIAWSTPVDLAPQYTSAGALLIHYGSPVITAANTVVLPVKTGATDGFRVEARDGATGTLRWSLASDYRLPAHDWVPSYGPTLAPSGALHAPGAGGKLIVRDNPDSALGTARTTVFFGDSVYAGNPAAFDSSVFINTPITADAQGNLFFGFIVAGPNPAGLVSGLARVGADGSGRWVAAAAAADDSAIAKVATNAAPAMSPDQRTVYVAVNKAPATGSVQSGYLLALDSTTLAVQARVALLDPAAGTPARVSDNSTASPTVGPDGRVFFGVLESVFGAHNARGWMLQFDPLLAASRTPGSFGWDTTASIVPAAMVPSYGGASGYLVAVKYNNYAGRGDGMNRLAVLDPSAAQADNISGRPVMREVLTILGPTFESGNSGPVKEWCINTMAVDPFTKSILVNSEDGILYRWDLPSNSFPQKIRLTSGLGQA
ncbi:MAG: hypothetical protein ABIR89_08090, partial [Ramlibacter sp.]